MLLACFSLVLFIIAAWNSVPVQPYWHRLVAAGLACWVAIQVLGYSGIMR